ncbi:MAG: hypothetical protein ACKVP5_05335 [Aestuariivirga sp.]
MSLPKPEAGLVIRYSYLWHREYLEGRDEGSKDRPCAIVLAVQAGEIGEHVLVVPVTHAEPVPPTLGLELPQNVKRHLGLDDARSWVIYSESNVFRWPGPDLRRLPGQGNESVAYGFLPPRFFAELRRRLVSLEATSRARRVTRSE